MRKRYLKHVWCYWDCCRSSICIKHFESCKKTGWKEWRDWLWVVWTTGFEPPWLWRIRNRKYLKKMPIDNNKSV